MTSDLNFKVYRSYECSVIFESSISVDGVSYLLIYGSDVNGYFCCIPIHNIGCMLGEPCDTKYNTAKLIDCGLSDSISSSLANAIDYVFKNKYFRKGGN